MKMEHYIKLTDFAKRLGVSRQSVFREIEAGLIKEYKRFGKITLIHLSELEKYRARRVK